MFQVFTEGEDDKKFIEDFLIHIGKPLAQVTVKSAGGWTKLHLVDQFFHQNTALGGTNLILFDADQNFAQRLQEIQQVIATLHITTELFLFPNHTDNGNFDTLQIAIANPQHEPVHTCFDGYDNCIRGLGASYTPPTLKDKVFAYFQALGANAKPTKRDYRIAAHWNLDHPLLLNLRTFLDAIIN
jgi:hypothetical protein